MEKNEMLYEISLKYNTLKMYENTLEQMRNNDVCDEESISRIEKEKNDVEKELIELLKPEQPEYTKKENKFISEAKKYGEYKELYGDSKDFFNSIVKNEDCHKVLEGNQSCEYKKPTFAEIQEKISNSQWISCSNFIVSFPKDEIEIDEWKVSGFYYTMKGGSGCSSNRKGCDRGEISVIVNDFAEKREDGTYNILSKIVNKLYAYKVKVLGDIVVEVIDNSGELLYTLCFTKCIFSDAVVDDFSYKSTDLRRFYLNFTYDIVYALAPGEKISSNETAN